MDKIDFCYIPPGPFQMGSPAGDAEAFDDEGPLHSVTLAYGYWLGRFPVTVAQFTRFVEQSGYFPRDDEPLRDLPHCPVTHVNLRDVKACCRWLQGQWQQQGLLPPGWQVTVPSEAEWEKAARGGLEVPVAPLLKPITEITAWQPGLPLQANPNPTRCFPWGDEPDSRRANYDQAGIGRASMLGRFPGGVSPYGCEELSGNVREWTRSTYRAYPYDPHDGRETWEAVNAHWVLRGGSCRDFKRSIRCATRFKLSEGGRSNFCGFRLALIPEARP
jgi:iron(II)-dependent oxidoreductase